MKNILIVSNSLPYPLNAGGNIGVFEMINHFRQKYNITFVFPSYKVNKNHIQELKALWPNVNILPFEQTITIKKRISNYIYYRIQHLYYKLTFSRFFSYHAWIDKNTILIKNVLKFYPHISDKAFIKYVISLVECNSFDLIQAEFYSNISLPIFLKKKHPIIFIHHELFYVRIRRELNLIAPNDIYLNTICELQERYELSMLKQFDKVVTVSDHDKILLSEYIDDENLYSSPLAIQIGERKNSSDYIFNNILTFLGGGSHYPNKDGVVWFLKNCFPLLKAKYPALKFHIIGSWDESVIKTLASEDVIFYGFTPNLENALYNSISIVPIRIGSGMRMKIIDAINHGIPFVTTSVGVEGLDFKDNYDCFIGDTDIDFVEKISELIQNTYLQNSFIKQSMNTLQRLYSFDSAIEKRQQLYNSILSE